MIYKIVDEMCQEGISDKLITKSLKATLIENDPALFGRLEGKHNPRNLEDMLKMLQFMDSRETTLTMEERFTQTKQKDSESALDYMDRLESTFLIPSIREVYTCQNPRRMLLKPTAP